MRIVCASAEAAPAASVGGLGAAVTGLVTELRRQGVDVDLVIPDYGNLDLVDETSFTLDVPDWARWAEPLSARRGSFPGVGSITLLGAPGLARSHPYLRPDGEGWPDNDQRFLAFSQAIAAYVRLVRPDLVHLNDWHTATALAALDPATPTVLSIHNLAYQGQSAPVWLSLIGPRSSAFEWFGSINPLSGGIALADAVVAVSPTYATEILTPAGGCGLDDVLGARAGVLHGVLNGIDTEVWDPASDAHLPVPFSVADPSGKRRVRSVLTERLGMPDDDPLVVVVTRLTHQKGIDLLIPLIPVLAELPARLAILGSGEEDLARRLHQVVGEHPDRAVFIEGFDEELSHLMFAGGDIALVPSRFEPCGLTQMQAMRYGTLPVVTAVGGLVDTVPDVTAHPESGLGVVAQQPDTVHLALALARAVALVRDPATIAALRRRMMERDWSWRQPAGEYRAIYRSAIDAHGRSV